MKVAVCLSGQLRTFDKTYNSIIENLVKPNNADVFIHSWDETNISTGIDKSRIYACNTNNIDKVLTYFNPQKYVFDKPMDFIEYNDLHVSDGWIDTIMKMHNMSREDAKQHCIRNTCSMFYSIYKCNELKNTYANENNFEYDYIIRCRFDLKIKKPIYISQFSNNKLYYHNLNQQDNMVSDWFNISNNNNMNIYSDVFKNIYTLNNLTEKTRCDNISFRGSSQFTWGNEYLIREILHINKIEKQIHNFDIEPIYS